MQRIEIYHQLLEAYEKQFERENPTYYVGTLTHPFDGNEYVVVTFNNKVAYFFRREKFMISLQKLAEQKPLLDYNKVFAPHCKNELRDCPKNTYEDIEVHGKPYRVVKASNKWIDVKNLKWFYKPTFKTTFKLNTGVWLFEKGEPVGFIMPLALNYKEANGYNEE